MIEKNAEIIEERIAFGDATIERALKGEMPLYSKDDKVQKKIWIEWADGQPTMAHTQAVPGVTPAEFLTFRENFIDDFNYISPKIARYYELEIDPEKTWIKLMARVDFGIPFNAPRSVPVIAYIL